MTVGRVAITTEEMLSNEAIAHFKFNNKTLFTKEYLYLFLKLYQYDSLGSTSSIVTAINSTMIKEMEIIIPDNEKMSDFQDNTELLFNKIRQNQKQIHTLEKMRDTLLPKLMSGEVMVNVNTKI
jgi:type I restriction enzyme S subunit